MHTTLPLPQAALAVCVLVAAPFRLTAQDEAAQQPATKAPIVLTVPGSTAAARVWTAPSADGIPRTHYQVSLDGVTFAPPRLARYDVLLRYARFDPAVDRVAVDTRLESRPGAELQIVQFATQGLEAYRDALRARGAEVVQYLAHQAVIARMTPAVQAAVRELPFVRAVAPFHPAYKLSAELLALVESGGVDRVEEIKVNLLTSRRGPAGQQPTGRLVEALGGNVHHVSPETWLMTVSVPGPRLVDLAASDDVQWLDPWSAPEEDMDVARQFHGANYVESQLGATGQGVRVEVMDGGCDEIHPDIQNFGVHSPINTPSSHGTACSGIVVGSGAGNAAARGVLPDAFLAIGDYNYFAGGSRYAHSAELVNPGLSWQVVLQSNSWGNSRTRSYTSISQDLDAILFDLENLSILQSQSNAGNQDSRPQAWAKNIISVGGVRHYNSLSKSDDRWAGGASIGPAADGRIKPDLASFYDNILCTDRVGSAGYSSSNYTSTFGGTSGATPIVAGHLGLFYQLWHQGVFGNATPGSTVFANAPKNTTAKAFLINTATQWAFSGTSSDLTRTHQGWGHPDIQRMYDLRSEAFVVDETDVLGNLAATSHQLQVLAGTPSLKATLVYRDPPGTVSSSQHRINDLDLTVTSPGGTVYRGNNGLLGSQWSSAGGSSNTVDTVENVFVQSPQAGVWTVEVRASELNQDSHPETGAVDADYALVVTGVQPVTGPLPPTAPTGLVASATGQTTVSLSWSDNAGDEDGYRVERGGSASGPWSAIASLGANATSYGDGGLTAGTTYWYRVFAFNAAGDSGASNTADATTDPIPQPPAAPSGLSASATGQTTIALSWSDNAGDEDGYRVERGGSASGPWSTIASLGANATSYGDSGLTAATTYWYRVFAFNGVGDSGASNTADATTDPIPQPPAAPSGLSASATGQTTIALSWSDNAGDEDGYRVERGGSSSGPWSTVATLGANATSYGDGGLTAATTYWYRVFAFNAAGDSGASNTDSATTDPVANNDEFSDRLVLKRGSQVGSHTLTHDADGSYHALTEENYRSGQRSRLVSEYRFENMPAGAKTLYFKGYHSASPDDDFRIQVRNGSSWQTLITVTKTSDDGQYQTATIPEALSGRVRIRVRDTNRSNGGTSLDTIYIDHLFIRL